MRLSGSFISLALIGVIALCILAVPKRGSAQSGAVPAPGDVDGDGNITLADAIITLRLALNLDFGTTAQLSAADVAPVPGTEGRPFGDGQVTVKDAILILQMAIGAAVPLDRVSLDPKDNVTGPSGGQPIAREILRRYRDWDLFPLVRFPRQDPSGAHGTEIVVVNPTAAAAIRQGLLQMPEGSIVAKAASLPMNPTRKSSVDVFEFATYTGGQIYWGVIQRGRLNQYRTGTFCLDCHRDGGGDVKAPANPARSFLLDLYRALAAKAAAP